jgi:Zn ribbon nucleic-acid-binding protein
MGNRQVYLGWEFDREELCFNCRFETIQRIKISPEEMISQCTDCGAEPHYRLDCDCVNQVKPDMAMESAVDREFGRWRFVHDAMCPNCGEVAGNEIIMDIDVGVVVCNNCLYTRQYKFDMYNRCWRR